MDARTIAVDDRLGDVVFVVVRGEHDIYTAPKLRDQLGEAVGAAPTGVVVDITAATFVDSSILGALLEARRQAGEAGVNFVVNLGESPEPGVRRILEITGLVPVFPVVRSDEEALAAARSGPGDEAP